MLSKSITKAIALARHYSETKNLKPVKEKGVLSARVNAKAGQTGAIYLYDLIGKDWWTGDGVTAGDFVQALDGLKGVKTLDVYINSPGGDVMEAKAMYTNLMRFEAHKVVHIDGLAASAATFVAMAGDQIITSPEATWMIHEAWGGCMGEANDLRAYADLLDMQNADLAAIYSRKTGLAEAQVRDLMAAETWMNASKALELKFTDAIETFGDDEVDEDADALARAKESPMAKFAAATEKHLTITQAARQEFVAKALALKNKVTLTDKTPGKPGEVRTSGKPVGR